MRLVDAIQQYQAIVYEVTLGDNTLSNEARDEFFALSQFLTKELGTIAIKAIQEEAANRAKNHIKSYRRAV
jgi:hypothetical protein|tara:strand:+ start:76 stop:288 length:213 start_codon:yes stop_codon:yes gene_type:complete